nr:MAG TPA: hypothetical protein [Caudoviricetes sp.]
MVPIHTGSLHPNAYAARVRRKRKGAVLLAAAPSPNTF